MGKLLFLEASTRFKLKPLAKQRPPAPNATVWTDAQDDDACNTCAFPFLPGQDLVLWHPGGGRVYCGTRCYIDRGKGGAT